jgi:hypothetical protein
MEQEKAQVKTRNEATEKASFDAWKNGRKERATRPKWGLDADNPLTSCS